MAQGRGPEMSVHRARSRQESTKPLRAYRDHERSSEFGRRALARVAGLDDVDAVIIDAGLAEGAGRLFGAELVRADPP